MDILLWAFISLQFTYIPSKVGDIDVTPHHTYNIFVSPRLKRRPELWSCQDHRCYFHNELQPSYSIYWRQHLIYINN